MSKYKSLENAWTLGSGILNTEPGALVVHPENIRIGKNVHIGANVILEAYHLTKMEIGDGCWIGSGCFFHSAGGIKIGKNVGFGPGVKILTSAHTGFPAIDPVIKTELWFDSVEIGDGVDIGAGAIILPGVKIGEGSIIGAGSVVTKGIHIPAYQVWTGNPCKFLRHR